MVPRTITALVLAAGFAGLLIVMAQSNNGATPTLNLIRSTECEQCHPEVFAEWERMPDKVLY